MADDEPSYIDYEAFCDPEFSTTGFANSLVLATNNASDTPLDLSTPLSRVLFDVQEIDTHIDTLTVRSALPLLEYTREHAESGARILGEVESQVASLTEGYKTLEKDVIGRYEAAEQVRLAAQRLCQTVKIGRAVAHCLMLGRQLEAQLAEIGGPGAILGRKEDHRAMIRSSNTLVALRQLLLASGPGEEGEGLDRIDVIATLRSELLCPAERTLVSRSQSIVREFSMSLLLAFTGSAQQQQQQQPGGAASMLAQAEDTKSRTISALLTLYLLSPVVTASEATLATLDPALLVDALQEYLQTALKASLAALTRALASLATLERTLLEVSARCQNVVALETLLESVRPPPPPAAAARRRPPPANFLQPLLHSLDTSSLASYFWRSLASALSPRVQELVTRGGGSARTLRSNRDAVRDAIRECVNRGSQLPAGVASARAKGALQPAGNWEREAAVMVGAVVGNMAR